MVQKQGGHSDGSEGPHGCLQMSKVFIDSSFIFEINVNSQNLLHDWCCFNIY